MNGLLPLLQKLSNSPGERNNWGFWGQSCIGDLHSPQGHYEWSPSSSAESQQLTQRKKWQRLLGSSILAWHVFSAAELSSCPGYPPGLGSGRGSHEGSREEWTGESLRTHKAFTISTLTLLNQKRFPFQETWFQLSYLRDVLSAKLLEMK